MRFCIVVEGVPGHFRASSAWEAARKARAFETLGCRWAAHDEQGKPHSLPALDDLAKREVEKRRDGQAANSNLTE